LVIGGGIVGLMTAFELMRHGSAVTLLERGPLARQSSWAGGGLLSPLYPWRMPAEVWSLCAESMTLYPVLCDLLRDETGIDPEWMPSGLTLLDEGEIENGLAWARQQGLTALPLTASRGLTKPQAALHLPWVAQVRNPRLCKALAAYLRQQGVEILEQVGAVGIDCSSGFAQAVNAHQRWSAEVVVVCAGAWTTEVLAAADWQLDIRPIKGQMLLLRGEPGAVPGLLLREGRYLIPRADGRVLVGSTLEQTGFDAATSIEAARSLREFADTLVPACQQMPLEAHWAGLRPGSAEGIPAITRHPRIRNLYVNAGHYRYGLTMAPASARRLAVLVSSQ